jgi:hypothetical protein
MLSFPGTVLVQFELGNTAVNNHVRAVIEFLALGALHPKVLATL